MATRRNGRVRLATHCGGRETLATRLCGHVSVTLHSAIRPDVKSILHEQNKITFNR